MQRTPRRMSCEMVRVKKQDCSLYNTQEHCLDRHIEINVNMTHMVDHNFWSKLNSKG